MPRANRSSEPRLLPANSAYPTTAEVEEAERLNERAWKLMIEEAVLEGPPELRHKLTGPYIRLAKQQPPLALQVSKAADGRLVCTGLLIGWQLDRHPLADPVADRVEITARQLRAIHLPEILAEAVRSQPDMLPATAPTVRPPHPGNVGYPDEYYENIARQYRDALVVKPGSPMKRLAKQLNVAPATAYRLRDEAIRRGFLEPRPKQRRGPTRETGSNRKGS